MRASAPTSRGSPSRPSASAASDETRALFDESASRSAPRAFDRSMASGGAAPAERGTARYEGFRMAARFAYHHRGHPVWSAASTENGRQGLVTRRSLVDGLSSSSSQ